VQWRGVQTWGNERRGHRGSVQSYEQLSSKQLNVNVGAGENQLTGSRENR